MKPVTFASSFGDLLAQYEEGQRSTDDVDAEQPTAVPSQQNGAVQVHGSRGPRPIDAPELPPNETPLFGEMPSAEVATAKLGEIAGDSTGEKAKILERATKAARKAQQQQQTEIRIRVQRNEKPKQPVTGRIKRETRRKSNGEIKVRVMFDPDGRGRSISLDPQKVQGLPNGANVTLRPASGRGNAILDPEGAHPVKNMVGTVERRGNGLVLKAATTLSPIRELPLPAADDSLVGKTVVVDVREPMSPKRFGVVHDLVDTSDPLKLRELRAAVDAGLPATFPPDVLRELQEILANPPDFEPEPGMRDMRDKTFLATDNPGSTTDHKSVDPEQATYVEERPGGGYIVYDALADRRAVVPKGSKIDEFAFDTMLTFYGSGFDLPTMPKSLSEDLLVFLRNQPRYATVVQTSYDAQGNPIPEETQVYDALVNNTWDGSYRAAERYYAGREVDLDDAQKAQLDLFSAAGKVMAEAAAQRGMLVNRKDGRYWAEQIREQFSVNAGYLVDEIVARAGGNAVHRYHPEAGERKQERFREFAEALGVPWRAGESLQEYMDRLDPESPLTPSLANHAVRSMESARFSATEVGHYALAVDFYAQATASNRRNTDMPNLEQAKAATKILAGEDAEFPYSDKELEAIAELGNTIERIIESVVERQIDNLRDASQLAPYEGKEVRARVHDLSPAGMVLETTNPSARIFLPTRRLSEHFSERFELFNKGTVLTSDSGAVGFSIGDFINVRINQVDEDLGYVDVLPTDFERGRFH